MQNKDILYRDCHGMEVSANELDYKKIRSQINKTQQALNVLNYSYHEDQQVRELLGDIIGKRLDDSVRLLTPVFIDYGKNITIGKNVFINAACTLIDRGGIVIEDHVFIGPKVNLITTNHDIHPERRHVTTSHRITIKENAWLGANITVLPGITVGKNAIVSAGAVVTKDVPDNVIVAGCPAKVIKYIE
ncbi:MAG: DapH/DapD/GlmU-related protein [Vagococcus sp.]